MCTCDCKKFNPELVSKTAICKAIEFLVKENGSQKEINKNLINRIDKLENKIMEHIFIKDE